MRAIDMASILLTCAMIVAHSSANEESKCNEITSCGSCITKKFCTWCVTKSRCTKQNCGNDNVIYPKSVNALMSGPDFCPRIVHTQELILKSGKRQKITVKITQIYLYMAFTPWKCKISVNGQEHIVIATLLVDTVLCESFEFKNESDQPSIAGSITVLWDYNKPFDGSLPFQVCRCDLDETCAACIKKILPKSLRKWNLSLYEDKSTHVYADVLIGGREHIDSQHTRNMKYVWLSDSAGDGGHIYPALFSLFSFPILNVGVHRR